MRYTNLRDKFKDVSLEYSDRIAIKFKRDDRWIDILYHDFRRDVESISTFLSKEGIRKDDKVALLLENKPEWPLIFFALVSIGAIAVPINPQSNEREMEDILKNSGCKLLFTSDDLFNKISLLKSASLNIISCDSNEFKDAVRSSEGIPDLKIELLPTDLACILYTSGTTDEPKGVMLSHKNLLFDSEALHQLNLFTYEDSVLSILPLHHAYPLMVTMLTPLLHGGKIVYAATLRIEELLKAMREANPTFFVAVPQVFYLFYKEIKERLKSILFPFNILFKLLIGFLYKVRSRTGINLARYLLWGLHKKFGRRMRLFISGGAKLDERVEETLFKFGFTILEGYGLTETSPVLTMNPLKRPRIGSAGLPIPGVELKIKAQDESGAGEVVVRGPNVMVGYYQREDLTAQVLKDGWFHTGDLGYIDSDGHLFLTGRLKEVVVLSSGKNIYPEEIEEAYSAHAPIKEVCVFEVPAKKGRGEGFVLWAVVVPDLEFFRRFGEVNLRAVIKERFDNVSRTLAPYKRIMGFSITFETLPRTLLGKVKRFAVKDMYIPKIIEEERIPRSVELSKEDIGIMELESAKKIIDYLKKETRVKDAVAPSDLLELDLGIDSLGRIELASGLERVFGIKIRDEIVGKSFTVKDLIMGIESLLVEEKKPLPAGEREIAPGPDYWHRLFQVLPRKENLEKIDLNPGIAAWIAGLVFIYVHYILFRIFHNLRVEGRENFPKTSPYILYVNHTSYYDGFLVAASLPNFPRLDLFFVGFRPYLNVPITRKLIKIGRVIPLDFSTHLLEALRSSYYVLKNGKSLCLFPEGLRTLDGNINEFKKGFGILVKESGAKLVPVILDGSFEAWPRTSKFPRPHPIRVRFGKVLKPEDLEKEGFEMSARDSYEAICIAARRALIELKEKG